MKWKLQPELSTKHAEHQNGLPSDGKSHQIWCQKCGSATGAGSWFPSCLDATGFNHFISQPPKLRGTLAWYCTGRGCSCVRPREVRLHHSNLKGCRHLAGPFEETIQISHALAPSNVTLAGTAFQKSHQFAQTGHPCLAMSVLASAVRINQGSPQSTALS